MTAQVIDLTDLTAADGFIVQGDQPGDVAGRSVSNAGDVNGDGIDDFIVGAIYADNPAASYGGFNAGKVYVIFGKTGSVRPSIDLTNLAASDGFVLQGASSGDRAAYAVSDAGDVNGDGIDDLIVTAISSVVGGSDSGAAYVVFGKAGATRADVALATLSSTDGFAIFGAEAFGIGASATSAGDINGDGFDDIVISGLGASYPVAAPSSAYIIYGKAGATRANIDLGAFGSSDGFTFTVADGSNVVAVSAAGDINGDSIDDLIISDGVGAPRGGGAVFALFGVNAATRPNLTAADISSTVGFTILGAVNSDGAGRSLANLGDVNGDGIDDFVIGATESDSGGDSSGTAYVIYGKTGASRANIDLAALSASDGFIIQGDAAFDRLGISVSGAGDFNGDGIGDIIVGAYGGDDGGTNAGEAYVIFGKSGATRGTVDVTTLALADGVVILGDVANDNLGRSVSAAGDVNGDGTDDIIVGAPGGDNGGTSAGEAYIIYGSRTFGTAGPIEGTAGADTLTGTAGDDTINGLAGDDVLVGGAGSDTMNGGTGNDIFVVTDAGDVVNEAAGEGRSDSVETNLSSYTLPANVENLEYTGAASFTGTGNAEANHIVAGSLDDTLNGGDGDDTLAGEAGNDTLNGGNGADRLFGGTGADIMNGNDGNDRLTVDNAGDVANGGDGIDTVEISASLIGYTVAADVEIVRNISGGNLTVQLNDLANTYGGSTGQDFVGGGAGNDSLYGRGGGDLLFGEDGNDFLFGETGEDSLSGGNGIDRIYGGADNDILLGEAGNDTLYGEAGTDQLFGGTGFDLLNGGAGGDLFGFNLGDSSNSRATADRVQDFSQAQGDRFAISAGRAFIGTADFSGAAGQIRYSQAGGNTFIEIDVDGNGVLDEIIRLDGLIDLTGADFLLR